MFMRKQNTPNVPKKGVKGQVTSDQKTPDTIIGIVLPGDDITDKIDQKDGDTKMVIGPGLRRNNDRIVTVKCGLLKNRNNMYWIDSHQKRYIATKGDRVIGIVVNKSAFNAKVDIGAYDLASLSLLAFEGATKKNKPNIEIGDVIYASVLTAIKDMESELVCVNSRGKRDGMGSLGNNGFVVTVPIEVVRRILSPECKLLEQFGNKFRYECAAGMNGRVWVNATTMDNTIAICDILTQLEHLPINRYEQLYEQIMQQFEPINRRK